MRGHVDAFRRLVHVAVERPFPFYGAIIVPPLGRPPTSICRSPDVDTPRGEGRTSSLQKVRAVCPK